MSTFHSSPLFRRLAFACLLLLCPAWLHAADATFIQRLSAEDRAAAGIDQLAPSEISALDSMVDRDVSFARQGDVVAFANTFSQRRSAAELTKAGVVKLTETQTARLNALIAEAIAHRPAWGAFVPPPTSSASGAPSTFTTVKTKPQIHGSFSLTVGTAGHGQNFYGGDADVWMVSPDGRTSIEVSYSEYHGKGLGLYGPYCGPFLYRR